MNPSAFNSKVTLHKREIVVDKLGREKTSFNEYGTFWSCAYTTRSSEAILSGNLKSLKQIRFVLRYSKKLEHLILADKTHFSLTYKSVEYDILSVINDDEKNKTVTIIAEGRE